MKRAMMNREGVKVEYIHRNKKLLFFAAAFLCTALIVTLLTFLPGKKTLQTATTDNETLPTVLQPTTITLPTVTSASDNAATTPSETTVGPTSSPSTTATSEPGSTEQSESPSEESTIQDASAPACLDGAWKLTFEDNFQGNLDKWNLYDSPGHADNGFRRPSALEATNGNLIITAQQGPNGQTISGGMSAKHVQKFGRYEARVRTEADPSGVTSGVVLTWPAGSDGTAAGYPAGGENDFYETAEEPRDRNEFYTFIHMPDISNGPIQNVATGETETILRHSSSATEWHHMVMEWQDNEIKIFRDGVYVGVATDPTVVPNVDHYLTLQLDAKNSNPMGPNVVRMYVDWVRIYERAAC